MTSQRMTKDVLRRIIRETVNRKIENLNEELDEEAARTGADTTIFQLTTEMLDRLTPRNK